MLWTSPTRHVHTHQQLTVNHKQLLELFAERRCYAAWRLGMECCSQRFRQFMLLVWKNFKLQVREGGEGEESYKLPTVTFYGFFKDVHVSTGVAMSSENPCENQRAQETASFCTYNSYMSVFELLYFRVSLHLKWPEMTRHTSLCPRATQLTCVLYSNACTYILRVGNTVCECWRLVGPGLAMLLAVSFLLTCKALYQNYERQTHLVWIGVENISSSLCCSAR